ncbi:hypothetical protein ACJZ2D_013307 [Fusarium nematophilum]
MEWFGRADISFIHAASTRIIRKKDGSETDLLEICEQCTPPCRLNPLLFNGHLQTVWTLMKPHGPKVYYKRRIFEANNKIDSGTFAVDFAVGPFEGGDPTLPQRTMHFTDDELQQLGSNDERPMLVVLHGLSGGSHEAYLRLSIAPLLSEGGWEVCVVNSRGCAQSKITSGVLYNARATWDIRQTVRWLSTTFPNRPLFGMGFSLGANILTNYCGEEGPNCLLNGVVVCSNPFNLEISSKMLQSTYVGREVYSRKMSLALKELLRAHREELKRWSAIDVDAALKATYLNEFDRLIQCPSWGYPTEDAYYRDASSTDAILNIKIPFFAINSTDDPASPSFHPLQSKSL